MLPAGPKPREPIDVGPLRPGAKPNPPKLGDPNPSDPKSESAAEKFSPTPGKPGPRPTALAPKPAPLEPKPAASEPKSATPLDEDDPMSTKLSSAPRPELAPVPALLPTPLPVDPARLESALSGPDTPEALEDASAVPLPVSSCERPDADCVGCARPCSV